MTRSILFAAAALAALAAAPAARAEDQPGWTGFYVGLNAGGTWGDTTNTITAANGSGAVTIPPGDITTINGIGASKSNGVRFEGGGEGGYNYQMGNLVLGLETDFDAFQVKQVKSTTFTSLYAVAPPVTFTLGQRVTTDWLWTLRPRLGYAFGRFLIYGTGGLAVTPVKLDTTYSDTRTPPNSIIVSRSDTKTGWTAGAGAAYQILQRVSLKAEWLYSDFGAVGGSATASDGYATIASVAKVRAHLIRVGVDYRF